MYQLAQPAPALAPFIEHYWSVHTEPGGSVDLSVEVYVDARADLILNFGAPYSRTVRSGTTTLMARSNFDAQRTEPITIRQQGEIRVCGVRFHTAGVSVFVNAPLYVWTNRTPEIADVFGKDASALDALASATADRDAMKRILDRYFLARLLPSSTARSLLALKRRIEANEDGTSVAELCAGSGIALRQVGRLFRQHLGISAKAFSGIVRFQRALNRLKSDSGLSLADVAASCRYYDQSHLVKDFKRYAGGVPRAFKGYFPKEGPADFSPNVVRFLQDGGGEPT